MRKPMTDEDIERYAQRIVNKRGKYRYGFTDTNAIRVVMDVLLDFRDIALSNEVLSGSPAEGRAGKETRDEP